MADTTTVVEGKVKYRDGRKWKQRWCVLKKPSPVADRLQVLLYKDVKDAIKDGCKPKSCFPIENFYGLQSGFSYDKETNVVAIVCQKQIVLFSFENWEDLIQFEIQIRRNLGEEHQFKVQIVKMPSHSKLPNDYVRLLIHDQKFCFTSHAPPKLLQSWHICDLRRFGTVDGRFLFEGGSRCNKGAGLHAIRSEQSVEIGEIVHLASLGKIGSCQRNANKRGAALAYERALQTLQKNRIVIIVEDFKERLEKDDNASLSSNDYPENCSLESTGSVCGDSYTCSPAKTVLRPRSGREYTIVQRCKKEVESSRPSPSSSPTSPVSVFTFDIHDPYLNTLECRGTISSPAAKLSSKSDDSAPSSPWIPLPQRCLKNKLDMSPTEGASVRHNSVSYSVNDSQEKHNSSSIPKLNRSIQKSSSTLRKKSEKKRSSSTKSQPDPGNYHKSTDHYVNLFAHDSDSEGLSLGLQPKNESVAYNKSKTDSVYLRLWDDKPSTSRSPKVSVSSDSSPPSTPLNPLLAPLTPIDDEHVLMYVEIDLEPSESTPKPKKPVPKSSEHLGVEYTNIDLVATKALKAAGEEHAQDRTDSLRRSRSVKYPQLSHHSSFRDRKESTSSRNRKFSASAIEFRA